MCRNITIMSNENKFPFRKPDGAIIWVSFMRMMEATNGRLTLDDGTEAVRARDLEDNKIEKAEDLKCRAECVSDALGFPSRDLQKHADFIKREKILGVDFRPDPDVPGFTQVVCTSQAAKFRYAKARGFYDKNSHNGGSAAIGPHEIEQARELVSREHGDKPGLILTGESNEH